MDRYLVKRSSASTSTSSTPRFTPYDSSQSKSRPHKPKPKPKSTIKSMGDGDLTQHLLKTLTSADNPICWSDIGERSDRITSTSSGHQRGGDRVPNISRINPTDRGVGGSERVYRTDRTRKLNIQDMENSKYLQSRTKQEDTQDKGNGKGKDKLMKGVKIHINGLLRGTTDLELKRIVVGAGGIVLRTPQGATHIITSQQIIGPKAEKLISKTPLSSPLQIVSPSWIFDSLEQGRKLPVTDYLIVFRGGSGNRSVVDMFNQRRASSSSTTK